MSIHVPYRPEHVRMAEDLVADTRRNAGLAPLDLERFWKDQEAAMAGPFAAQHSPSRFRRDPDRRMRVSTNWASLKTSTDTSTIRRGASS